VVIPLALCENCLEEKNAEINFILKQIFVLKYSQMSILITNKYVNKGNISYIARLLPVF